MTSSSQFSNRKGIKKNNSKDKNQTALNIKSEKKESSPVVHIANFTVGSIIG